jgi:hypothetical protein
MITNNCRTASLQRNPLNLFHDFFATEPTFYIELRILPFYFLLYRNNVNKLVIPQYISKPGVFKISFFSFCGSLYSVLFSLIVSFDASCIPVIVSSDGFAVPVIANEENPEVFAVK